MGKGRVEGPQPTRASGGRDDFRDPEATSRAVARTPALTEGELSGLLADFRPLVQRLVREYGTSPELRQQLEATLEHELPTLVERFDPACDRSLKVHLIASLSEAAYLFACGGSAEGPPSRSRIVAGDPAECARYLALAVSRLPPRLHHAVTQWYYEAASVEEIAVQLGVRPKTVRRLLRRGVSTLRRQLSPQDRGVAP